MMPLTSRSEGIEASLQNAHWLYTPGASRSIRQHTIFADQPTCSYPLSKRVSSIQEVDQCQQDIENAYSRVKSIELDVMLHCSNPATVRLYFSELSNTLSDVEQQQWISHLKARTREVIFNCVQLQQDIARIYQRIISSDPTEELSLCKNRQEVGECFFKLCKKLPLPHRLLLIDQVGEKHPDFIIGLPSSLFEQLNVPILVLSPLTECDAQHIPKRRRDIPPIILVSPMLNSSSYIAAFQQMSSFHRVSQSIEEHLPSDGFFPRQESAVKQMRDLIRAMNSDPSRSIHALLEQSLKSGLNREQKLAYMLTLWELAYCLKIEPIADNALLQACDVAMLRWLRNQAWDLKAVKSLCRQLHNSLFKSSYAWINCKNGSGFEALKNILGRDHMLDLIRSCTLDDCVEAKEILANLGAIQLPCKTTEQDLVDLVPYCPYVQHLDLSECRGIKGKGLAYVKELKELRHLNLSRGWEITDASLEDIETLTQLRHLNLAGSHQITDVGIKHLQPLTQLRHLNLAGCHQITDIAAQYLERLTQLTELNLTECSQLTDEGVRYLETFTQLNDLHLSGCHLITQVGLSHLNALKKLHRLYLQGCDQMVNKGLEYVKQFTELCHLDLSQCMWMKDEALEELNALIQLRFLSLKGCKWVSDAGLAHLNRLLQLEALDLQGCRLITDRGIEHLKVFTQLRQLSLPETYLITDVGVEHLTELTELQDLYLVRCRLTDVGMQHLQALTKIRHLTLRGSSLITDVGLACLQRLTQLQSLDLQGCEKISDSGLESLKVCIKLRALNLNQCRLITNVGLKHLQQLTELRDLKFRGCLQITQDAMKKMVVELRKRSLVLRA